MENSPKISVIIPIYKVGKYIENSMKSVCYQTFKDFEVLLVDNNTPDDSIEIAVEVLKSGQINYRVVKQPIQGLPAARNMGIAEAKGEWLISIDPDDTISRYFLEELYESAISNNLNVVFSEYDEVEEHTLFVFPEERKENALEILERDYTMNNLLTRRLPLMVSNMFFKKSFFVEKAFEFDQEVILGADLMLLWKILLNVDSIGHLNKKLYNHFLRPDSLMTAPSNEKIASNLAGYKRVCSYVSDRYSEEFSGWIYSRTLYALLSTVSTYSKFPMFKENYIKYYDKEVHNSLQSFPDRKIVYMDKLLSLSPRVFFHINKMLRQPHSFFNRIISSLAR